MLRLALGFSGFDLEIPAEIRVEVTRALLSAPANEDALIAALENPMSGPSLTKLAENKKRIAILLGDLSLPCAYPRILPLLLKHLTGIGIRPSRITLLCVPGGLCDTQPTGPIMGRSAIRRYGEATVGDYELRTWGGEHLNSRDRNALEEDPAYAGADLRIAILPSLPGIQYALPKTDPELIALVHGGLGERTEISSVRAGSAAELFSKTKSGLAPDTDVRFLTGGGFPADSTLEEALLSLRNAPTAKATVLAFQGEDGLGSAHFTRDLWTLLEQAGEMLEEGGQLPNPSVGEDDPTQAWDPAGALALALAAGPVLVFSPGLAEHSEGEELTEFLADYPILAERLLVTGLAANIWPVLEKWMGKTYRMNVIPLGWRAQEIG